jgi:glutamate/tyrosine decarboxylase-like PLP-dependent enzyme
MWERIEQLRAIGQALEPNAGQRAALRDKVVAHAEAFLEALPSLPAFGVTEGEGRGILESPISEEPVKTEVALKLLREHVDEPGVKLGSPGHLAFIPISTLHTAALGDYLAAVTNPFSGNFFAAPGAVRLEHLLTRWMAGFLGYPEGAAGNLTSGGSLSNLMAVVTAREAHELRARDYEKAVVYLSAQTHHSVAKALRIAGLKECPQRLIPLDGLYRMRPDLLDEAIGADRATGLRPWLVVATAGSTDTGAVDPLSELAQVAQRHGLWLHTDGAYGAVFALCPPGKRALAGIERSDSLVLDPHKGLFMPCGTGAVLVRNGAALLQAYSYEAHYMQDRRALASADEISPSELSLELTRPFRGLRLWLALKLHGVRSFRAALEEKLLLAQYFYERLKALDGFVIGPAPALSIVTFRCVPTRGDANEFNQRLLSSVQRDGRIFISSTTIDGNIVLRVAVLCAATHLETMDLALEVLKEKAAELRGW